MIGDAGLRRGKHVFANAPIQHERSGPARAGHSIRGAHRRRFQAPRSHQTGRKGTHGRVELFPYSGRLGSEWRQMTDDLHRLQAYGDGPDEEADDVFSVVGAIRVVGDVTAFVATHNREVGNLSSPLPEL